MQPLILKIKALINNRVYAGLMVLFLVILAAGLATFFYYKFSSAPDLKILVTEPDEACSLSFEVAGTAPIEGFSCTKQIKDAEGNDLSLNYKPKPLENVSFSINIVNTGNTVLNDLTLEDPLNATLSSRGAKNLDKLKYKSVLSSAGSCVYTEEDLLFKCTGINLQVGNSIEVSFIVELSANALSNTEIFNVSKVYNSTQDAYCSVGITSSAISNICNYTSGYCEQVFREKDINETACTADSDCVTETPKHLACVNEACVLVDGSGQNTCSSDSDCIPKKEKEETHLICKDKQCKEVSGKGDSECSKDSDCVYKKCVNESCTLDTCEDGDCEDKCDTSADCVTPTPVYVGTAPAATPAVVPATGGNDVFTMFGLFGILWVSALAFFAFKSWTFWR